MTIIFDIDGTLIGGEQTDWKCFDDAFEEAAGFALTSSFYSSLSEVTAKAIVHQALVGYSEGERIKIEEDTQIGYVKRLKSCISKNPDVFPAIEGAKQLIAEIQKRKIPIAIATGDWRESIMLKLKAADIQIDQIPITTSSDYYSRADIIRASISKASGSLRNSIYVGDGHWDLTATRILGIEFFGCGTKLDRLKQEGAKHLLDSLNFDNLCNLINQIEKGRTGI